MRYALTVGLALFVPANVMADDLADLARQVTGQGSRKWILEAVQNQKGLLGGCIKGEFYVFSSWGTVRHMVCKGDRLIADDLNWRLVGAPPQALIQIGARRYEIAFRGKGAKSQMRLRTVLSKAGGTNDLILRRDR